MAGVEDLLGGLLGGEVRCDGVGLDAVLLFDLGCLGVQLDLAAAHQDDVAAGGRVNIDEFGAEAAV